MSELIALKSKGDTPTQYQNTPISKLLEYHNFQKPLDEIEVPELIVGTCVDNRIQLRFPRKFAYVIRAGGANMKYNEFKLSYAIAMGNIQHMALIGHNYCGMSNLVKRKDQFIQGLVKNAGWSVQQATNQFEKDSPDSEIGNEIDFILSETNRLRKLYPKITIAPLMYNVEDNLLYFIKE